jgi:hypothetical protein
MFHFHPLRNLAKRHHHLRTPSDQYISWVKEVRNVPYMDSFSIDSFPAEDDIDLHGVQPYANPVPPPQSDSLDASLGMAGPRGRHSFNDDSYSAPVPPLARPLRAQRRRRHL